VKVKAKKVREEYFKFFFRKTFIWEQKKKKRRIRMIDKQTYKQIGLIQALTALAAFKTSNHLPLV